MGGTIPTPSHKLSLHLTVLGRTLEHLGVQMYKKREPAIAELIANCWDASAHNVKTFVPEKDVYDMASSSISIEDDGVGMSPEQIQNEYLVVGRNRRADGHGGSARPIMGRKGIGKLAGFGIANAMEITTWQKSSAARFVLEIEKLTTDDNTSKQIPIEGEQIDRPEWAKTESGTRLILRDLKHKTALDVHKLREALARRFSTKVRGEMGILVNGETIGEPKLELDCRFPAQDFFEEEISPGQKVRYYYGFAKETIKSAELRGFTVYAHGKTAQAPPFFFNVEGTASGQHGTKYVTGAIEADFLDDAADQKSDVISTDRQDVDWESEQAQNLFTWGATLARKVLRECAERKGQEMHDWILSEPAIAARVARLDPTSKKHVSRFLLILGQAEPVRERGLELGDSIVRAFEYRHFHDVIGQLDAVAEDPSQFHNLVSKLKEWRVLESRAVLEIVQGRLQIVDRFHRMILNSAPETASKLSKENFHDLVGGYPWILNPEWQIFEEEKQISKQLAEWGTKDISDEDERLRVDFLGLTDHRELVIVELKRPSHPVAANELLRLIDYRERLSKGFSGPIRMLMVYGGNLDVTPGLKESFSRTNNSELLTWAEVYGRCKDYYEHYRALLEGDTGHADFANKVKEVIQVRGHTAAIYRGPAERREGIGPQDKDNFKTRTIAVLAFGSLLFDLSKQLQDAIASEKDVITPFRVEYARSSSTRGGAPTLIPVDSGGAQVKAKLFVLRNTVDLSSAKTMLLAREGAAGLQKPGVTIREIPDIEGIDVVLVAYNDQNIKSPDPVSLAALAIASVQKAPVGKDGITYLDEMIKRGVITPLTLDYQTEILKSAQAEDLPGVLTKLKAAAVAGHVS